MILKFLLWDEVGALFDTVTKWLGQEKRGEAPSIQDMAWTGTEDIKGKLSKDILGKIGQPTPFKLGEQFRLPQPEVEAETEKQVLGRLRTPVTPEGIKAGVTEQAYGARKERMAERQAEEMTELKNMYNRLGLVSSTPGMTAQTKLRTTHGLETEDLSSQLMYEDINRMLEATRLGEDITTGRIGAGERLGAAQRGYEKFPMEMTMKDLERMVKEGQMTNADAMRYLGMGAPTPRQVYGSEMFQWQQPNVWDYAGEAGRDVAEIAKMIAMAGGG